jgi:hypothetical protein
MKCEIRNRNKSGMENSKSEIRNSKQELSGIETRIRNPKRIGPAISVLFCCDLNDWLLICLGFAAYDLD